MHVKKSSIKDKIVIQRKESLPEEMVKASGKMWHLF